MSIPCLRRVLGVPGTDGRIRFPRQLMSGVAGTDGRIRYRRRCLVSHYECEECGSPDIILLVQPVVRKRHQRHSHRLRRVARCANPECRTLMHAGYGPL